MATIQSSFDNTTIFGSGAEPKQSIFETSSTQQHKLGTIFQKADGRVFRYARAGAIALSKNLLNAAAAPDAQAITSTAQTAHGAAVGETAFTVLLTTGNGWTDNALIDGWLHVSDGAAAMGDLYEIKANNFATSDTIMNVTLADPAGVRTVIVAADDIILYANQMALTVVSPVDPVSELAGVALVDVPINDFYWAQYRGLASILIDGTDTIVAGDVVAASDSVVGTIHLNDALTDDVPIGICVATGAVSEPGLVNMNLS